MALKQNKEVSVIRMADGTRVMGLDLASLDWEKRLNKDGVVNVDSRVAAHEVNYEQLDMSTVPKVFGLALEVEGSIAEAGQITSRNFSDDGKMMSLQAAGLWAYLDRLIVHNEGFNFAVDDPKKDDVTLTAMSWRGIAGAIIMAIVNNPHNVEPVPPIVCDFAGEAGANSAKYLGADFTTVADAFNKIIDASGGVDLELVPEWVDGYRDKVQWRLVAGEPLLMQEGAPAVIEVTTDEGVVATLGVDEDGSDVATRVWATGADSVVMGANDVLVNSGYPLMEVAADFDVRTLAELGGELDGKLLDSSSTMSTWSLSMIVDDVLQHEPGDFINVVTSGYRGIKDGSRLVRVVGTNGNESQKVTYHLQPMLTTWDNFDPSKVRRRYHEPDPVRAEAERAKQDVKELRESVARSIRDAVGSGGGASLVKGVVSTADNDQLIATVKIGSDDVATENYAGRMLASGDDVVVATDSDGNRILLGKGLSADGTPGSWGPVRVSLGYPFLAGDVGMPAAATALGDYAQPFEDVNDAAGYGAGARGINTAAPNNLYPEPGTGVLVSLPTPGPTWIWNPRSMFIKEGKLWQWFVDQSSLIPSLFKWDRGGHKWDLVPGLPTQRNILGEGYWAASSVQGEMENTPCITMLTADPAAFSKPVAGGTGQFYRAYLQVWQVTPDGTGWTKSPKQSIDLQFRGFGGAPNLTSSSILFCDQLFNNGYFYEAIRISTSSPAIANYLTDFAFIQVSQNLSVASLKYLHTMDNGNIAWFKWFTNNAEEWSSDDRYMKYRVHFDGRMYFCGNERWAAAGKKTNKFLIKNPVTGEQLEGIYANPTSLGEKLVWEAYPVWLYGDKYLVTIDIESKKGTTQTVNVAYEFDLSTNSKTELVPDATPAGATSFAASGGCYLPVKLETGDVIAYLVNSIAAPNTSSFKMWKFNGRPS